MRTLSREPNGDQRAERASATIHGSSLTAASSTARLIIQRRQVFGRGANPPPSLAGAVREYQTSRKVSRRGDRYEREATRLADRAMQMPGPMGSLPPHQLDRGLHVPRRTGSTPASIRGQSRRGNRLDPSARQFFESRFGYSFANVRIHTDRFANESARSLGARAFTVGEHISFASGEYRPWLVSGRSLLAHELVHTAQQGALGERVRTDTHALSLSTPPLEIETHLPQNEGGVLMRYETGEAAIAAHTSDEGCSGSYLNRQALGRDLAGLALTMNPENHRIIADAFEHLSEGDRDDVAGHVIDALSDEQIRSIGLTDSGRIVMYRLMNYLHAGMWVTGEERSGAQSIEDMMAGITRAQTEAVEPRASLPAKTIHLKIVRYPGFAPSTSSFVDKANEILSQQCNIAVTSHEVAGDPADLNSFFGRANALDLGVNAETGEGDAVRERAGAQGASQIPVALVPYIVAGLIEGMEGFCPLRGYLVAVASSAGTTTDVLAHEIGHFFGLRHRDNNRRNLMADGSVRVAGPEGRLLSPWECSVIRSAL